MKNRFPTLAALVVLAAQAHAAESADQRFRDLEALLARAGRFDVKAHVVSNGAIVSDVNATLGAANEGIVAIHLDGSFNGTPDKAVLRTDGVVTMLENNGNMERLQPGHAMRQAVQLGFLRVGLWHNLMLLSHGIQPEHHQGGFATWANVDRIRYATTAKSGLTGLSFDVIIEGSKAGQATLWIDDASKMPVRREQSLTVDGKKIETIEDYSDFIPTA